MECFYQGILVNKWRILESFNKALENIPEEERGKYLLLPTSNSKGDSVSSGSRGGVSSGDRSVDHNVHIIDLPSTPGSLIDLSKPIPLGHLSENEVACPAKHMVAVYKLLHKPFRDPTAIVVTGVKGVGKSTVTYCMMNSSCMCVDSKS
jgi:hypothetical protein